MHLYVPAQAQPKLNVCKKVLFSALQLEKKLCVNYAAGGLGTLR